MLLVAAVCCCKGAAAVAYAGVDSRPLVALAFDLPHVRWVNLNVGSSGAVHPCALAVQFVSFMNRTVQRCKYSLALPPQGAHALNFKQADRLEACTSKCLYGSLSVVLGAG